MAVQRKVFRIEESTRSSNSGAYDAPSASEAEGALRHHEFMAELKALRALLEPHTTVSRDAMERSRAQIAEAQAYKRELDVIHAAIKCTRQESGGSEANLNGSQIARVTEELRAVVAGTELATQTILKAAEDIDQIANMLSAAVKNEHEQGLAHDIQDRVVQIFESCNFQDLTGQRVAKVGATLKFIEDHVARLTELWRHLERFEPVVLTETGGERLLNGPKLAGDTGHSSQHDIDSIFRRA